LSEPIKTSNCGSYLGNDGFHKINYIQLLQRNIVETSGNKCYAVYIVHNKLKALTLC